MTEWRCEVMASFYIYESVCMTNIA